MAVKTIIKTSEYHDSVSLMLVARELAKLDGVEDAAVVMATDANKSILAEADMLTADAKKATANDLVIAVKASSDKLAEQALAEADGLFAKSVVGHEDEEFQPKTHSHPGVILSVAKDVSGST